jgi:hypothetical protein
MDIGSAGGREDIVGFCAEHSARTTILRSSRCLGIVEVHATPLLVGGGWLATSLTLMVILAVAALAMLVAAYAGAVAVAVILDAA